MSVVAGVDELAVDAVDLGGRVAEERTGVAVMAAARGPPFRIERLHDLERVDREAEAVRQRRLDVWLVLGAFGELEAEPPVEVERPRHVGRDDADHVEPRH